MIDETVEEIRAHREAHAAKFNYNLRAIYEDLKKSETKSINMGHSYFDVPIEQTAANKSLHRTTAPLSLRNSQ